ncbi:MAG: hypothetical protein OHK0039_24260 [Bacteroidia bacterium]
MLTTTAVQAQTYELFLGDEYMEESTVQPPKIVGYNSEGYYALQVKPALHAYLAFIPIRLSKEATYIRRYAFDLVPKQTKVIDLRTQRNKEEVLDLIMAQGKLHLFSTFNDKRHRTVQLMHREVEVATLAVPAKGSVLATVSYDGFPDYKNTSFGLYLSRDSSKIMVQYQFPNRKDSPERFAVHLFNDEMIPLWNQEYQLPYAEGLFEIQRFRVDNEANAYLLGKRYRDRPKDRVKGEPNYDFVALVLNPNLDTPTEIVLDAPGRFLVDMHMEILRGRMICAGIYGEGKPVSPRGIYYLTLDATTQQVIQESYKPFALSMFDSGDDAEADEESQTARQQKQQEKKQRQREQSLYRYDFNDIVLRSDGGAVLVGEENYFYVVSTYVPTGNGGGYWRYTTYYYRNDILTIDISPEGQIDGITRVPKRQRQTQATHLISYAMAISQGRIHFVFNDRAENLALGPNDTPRYYTPSIFGKDKQVISLLSLDPSGTIERRSLLSTRDADMYALPQASIQVSSNELILFFYRGSRRRMGRITFL